MLGARRRGRHLPAHARGARATAPRTATLDQVVALAAPDAGTLPAGVPVSDTTPDTTPHADANADANAHANDRTPADGQPPDLDTGARRAQRPKSGRALLRGVVRRDRTLTVGGAQLRLLVLACTAEDTAAVDLASGTLLRLRVPWPEGHSPDLSTFDVVEATLAEDPERDDLAQPEAATLAAPPRRLGTLKGRRVRAILARLATTHGGPLLGFHGPSAPYWDFHGLRPSVALVHPARGPQLIRRRADGTTWVRFGWQRDDVWVPVEDARAVRALDASRRDRLAGKPLATALGFSPHFLLVALSAPRGGHCYKICAAVLPRG